MSSKQQIITKLAETTAREISRAGPYMDFLKTAANNFKYSFRDQLLIYAQKPDATACAEIRFWNLHRRWVNRGTKGIALLVDSASPYKLRYVFDQSDTNSWYGPEIPTWKVEPKYLPAIIASLENTFGPILDKDDFPNVLIQTARHLVRENLSSHIADLEQSKAGSLLEDLDETNTETWFTSLVQNSVAFMLLTRCGIDPSGYFSQEDFIHIYEFNTQETIAVLGVAVSDLSEIALREIAATIRTLAEKQRTGYDPPTRIDTERSINHEIDLSDRGRLPGSQPGGTGDPENREVRETAPQLSQGESQRDLHRNAALRETEPPPGGNRPEGHGDDGEVGGTDGSGAGRDGDIESVRPDEVGGTDEQHPGSGGGSRNAGSDLPVSALLPAVAEQQEQIVEAETKNVSAFVISQEDIDAVLLYGSGVEHGKYRIYEQFLKQESKAENVSFLKTEYGTGGAYPAVLNRKLDEWHDSKGLKISRGGITEPDAAVTLTWSKVEKRVGELIAADRYLNRAEKEQYPVYQAQVAQRNARWDIVKEIRAIIDDYVDFKTQLGEKDQCSEVLLARRCADSFGIGDKKCYVLTMEGTFVLPALREAMQTIIGDDTHLTERCETMLSKLNGPLAAPLEPTYGELHPPKKEHHFALGDAVYLGTQEYELLAFDAETVRLFDPAFPLMNKELPRSEFDRLLAENPLNDHLLQVVEEISTPEPIQDSSGLEGAKWLINEYCLEVFEEEADFSNLHHVDLAFSSTSDSEHTIEVSANLVDCCLIYQVDGEVTASLQCHDLDDLSAYLANLDFDEMIAYAEDQYYKQQEQSRSPQVEQVAANVPPPQERFEQAEKIDTAGHLLEQNEKKQDIVPRRGAKVSPFVLHPEIPNADRYEYRITDDAIGVGTPGARFDNNVQAIRLLKKLETEERFATPEEQAILAQYVGWGGLADYFDERHNKYAELKNLLTENEYTAARESTLTAFYTPPVIIRAIYQALENMGFQTGNLLEPSCGIGNFIGMRPETLADTKIYGIELDSISGRIARQLYQKSSIAVQGFEKTDLPDSFFDAAIGNVPFGAFKVSDKRYDKHNFFIHDYFFARTLDKVRPGGIIAFVTSKGTMDKENPTVRKYIAQRADLLGAIRLPNNTFKDAAGTEVTSDILFLQKRDALSSEEPAWVHLNTDENGLKMNQYFVDHPDMVMGEMREVSGPFGPETACLPNDGQDLGEQLTAAIQNIQGTITEYVLDDPEAGEEDRSIPADPNVRNFSYTVVDGEVYYRENSRMNPVEVSVTAGSRIKGMVGIRDCVRTLIEYQTEDWPAEDIKAQQKKLNALYDAFVDKYGRINSRANSTAFSMDSAYFLLTSLEVLDDERNFVRKADMFTKRTIKQQAIITSVDTASEALAVSLAERACVDLDYMAGLMGGGDKIPQVVENLKGVIFKDPLSGSFDIDGDAVSWHKGWQTADEYLSGNVREKLATARLAAKTDPAFEINVQALEKVQPADLTASEISVRLGATWLPTEIVEQFMFELFSTPNYCQWNIHVRYFQHTGEWNVEGKSYDKSNVKAHNTYGTSRINGYKIIEETLNLRDVRIFDYVDDEDGKKTPVLNKKETAIAQGKQELIKQAFQNWIWKDHQRRERLTRLYNDKFNSTRPREYDGSHLNFVGMNPEITLRKHQTDAIAHILYGGNTLLAHVVGAGKTFEMVAAAQESKRLGLCQKSLFVVPNHLTAQWASEYLQLYPSANILVATKKDFETKNRKRFCGRIATGDYDAIIMGHSQFEKIPVSVERQRYLLKQQRREILDGIAELKASHGERFSIKQMERTKKSIDAKLDKLNNQRRKDDVVTFEELGIDRIFIDEAHYYKNLAAFSKMRNVGGISQTEAQKSSDLYMKCRYLDELTGGRGVIFATGTPISNTMVEMYTMQKYLQYHTLERNGLLNFDAWASTFGETVTAIELAPEGTGYRAKTRFSHFYNLPELMAMFKEVADIQTADMLELPVPKANYHNIVLKPSEQQKEMVVALGRRAERVRNKMVDSAEDNMLLITNDGRKLALDQRLLNPMLPDSDTGKVSACAENVYEIWQRTAEQRSTQMVFCDLSTPKGNGDFNVYDDLRDKLIAKGMPAEEIAYVHSANTEAQKKELFGKVRSGQIRVLIGSTQKMGAGTNVQQKLVALHHLDCPWRPSDLQQREGRIIRQGNGNPEVDIYTYVTENTFDSYLYQLVEGKQKFIGQIMTSKGPVRSAEDIDETALSYAEIKALCTGNPHIKEKMDLDIDVQRLKLLKANHLSQRYALEDQIIKVFPQKIAGLEQRIDGYVADMKLAVDNTHPNEDGFSPMEVESVVYTDKKDAGSAILAACKAMTGPDPVPLGQYRGFAMELSFESFNKEYRITLKGALQHTTGLGLDIFGNVQRIDNLLNGLDPQLQNCKAQLENARVQLASAKEDVGKPFPQEEELKTKSARLDELNILLNMDKTANEIVDEGPENPEPPTRSNLDRAR